MSDIRLANSLELKVVARGMKTEKQLQLPLGPGRGFILGYPIGKPHGAGERPTTSAPAVTGSAEPRRF